MRRKVVAPDVVTVSARTNFVSCFDDGVELTTADGSNVSVGSELSATQTFTRWNPDNCDLYGCYGFGDYVVYASKYGVAAVRDNVAKNVFDVVAAGDKLFACDVEGGKAYLYAGKTLYRYDGQTSQSDTLSDVTAMAACADRLFCATGSTVLYSGVGSFGVGEEHGGGSLKFASKVTALCACGKKLYVFADDVYTVSLSYDQEYFCVDKIGCAHGVNFAVESGGKVYCFTKYGLAMADKPSEIIELPCCDEVQARCCPCVFDGKIYFCGDKKLYGYNPTNGSFEIFDGAFSSVATDGKTLYVCNGKEGFALNGQRYGASWTSKPLTFGAGGRKYLRKLFVKAKGNVVVGVNDGKRSFSLQLADACGKRTESPCYLDGDEFVVTVELAADARLYELRIDGVACKKEVNVCKNR